MPSLSWICESSTLAINIFELRKVVSEELKRLKEDVQRRVEVKRIATETRPEKLEEEILEKTDRIYLSSMIDTLQLEIERGILDAYFIQRSRHELFWFNVRHQITKHNWQGGKVTSTVRSDWRISD